MRKFEKEQDLRAALERDFPVPEALQPENINLRKKKANRWKRLTAFAAAIALLLTGTLTALYFNRSGGNVPVVNSYRDVYAALIKSAQSTFESWDSAVEDMDILGSISPGATNSGSINIDESFEKEPELSQSTSASEDYYKTYLQTEGVEEADQIKTDGRWIFYTSGSEVYVVDPRHGDPAVTDKVTLPGIYNSIQLYLAGEKLVVLYATRNTTNVQVFTVTEKGTLTQHTAYSQDGSYNDSRMMGDILYLITWEQVDYRGMIPERYDTYIPSYDLNGKKTLVAAEDIAISPSCPGYYYTIVGRIDIRAAEAGVSVKSALGTSATIYCSRENLYLMREFYQNRTYTEITRIALGETLQFGKEGEVEGYIKDQFSVDEYEGYLRIAVTRDHDNALFVLDKDLKIVGIAAGMGIDETIKSVSFDRNTAYVVTFRQTDPLYTVDLTDPRRPKVTDALKVSGFSTHLRQFGGLLLGFGQEADEKTGITSGIKLSMFKANEKGENQEIAKVVLGDQDHYAYSPAVWNHKFLMILPEKNLIGFPIFEDMDGLYYVVYRYEDGSFSEFAKLSMEDSENRALYIDDVIYIFDGRKMISVDMNTGKTLSQKEL